MAQFTHESTKKVVVDTIPIQEGYFIFKRTTFEDDVLVKKEQGIGLGSHDKVDPSSPIKTYWYDLYKEEVLEHHRKPADNQFNVTVYDKEFLIEDPYDYVSANGLTGLVLLAFRADYHLYGVDGYKHPRSEKIDYLHGEFDNSVYDLESALEILEKRQDVVIYEDNKPIPYYNVDEEAGRTHHISLAWIPTDEDWKKVKDIKDTYKLRIAIIRDVLGIQPK